VIRSESAAVLGGDANAVPLEIRLLGGLSAVIEAAIGTGNLTARKAQVLGQRAHAPARDAGEVAVIEGKSGHGGEY
jgi:hypothetical protein